VTIRLVDAGWGKELTDALRADASELKIICPFIKAGALGRFLSRHPKSIQVITRFNLGDFAEGVSDIAALRKLLEAGADIRGVRNLHAKLYLFGTSRAVVTSANLTEAAINRNHEFGMVAVDQAVIASCLAYFDKLWRRGGSNVTSDQIDAWDKSVRHYRASGGRPNRATGLGDFGADAGIAKPPPFSLPAVVADARQAFVKFLGEGDNRVSLSFSTIEEIKRAGCHWAVAYPAAKRPSGVKDDAVIFIARLTHDPNDIRIFGRAIGMRHEPGRDDATPEDIALRPWKAKWSRYIRVYHAEFVAGTMANGVSLNDLMATLGADSFLPTQRNAARGQGHNTDPRRSYRQQAAVELSSEGLFLLSEQLQFAFDAHGQVPQDTLDNLDWPVLPIAPSSGSDG
jgi:HKD family nuclease